MLFLGEVVVLLVSSPVALGLEVSHLQAAPGYVDAIAMDDEMYLLPHEASKIGVVRTQGAWGDVGGWSFEEVDFGFRGLEYRGGCLLNGVIHLVPYTSNAPTFRWDPRTGEYANETTLGVEAERGHVACVATTSGKVVMVPGAAKYIAVGRPSGGPQNNGNTSSSSSSSSVAAVSYDFVFDNEIDAQAIEDPGQTKGYSAGVADGAYVYLVPYDARSVAVVDADNLLIARRIPSLSVKFAAGVAWMPGCLVFAPSDEGFLGILDVREDLLTTHYVNVSASTVLVVVAGTTRENEKDDLAILPSRDYVYTYSLAEVREHLTNRSTHPRPPGLNLTNGTSSWWNATNHTTPVENDDDDDDRVDQDPADPSNDPPGRHTLAAVARVPAARVTGDDVFPYGGGRVVDGGDSVVLTPSAQPGLATVVFFSDDDDDDDDDISGDDDAASNPGGDVLEPVADEGSSSSSRWRRAFTKRAAYAALYGVLIIVAVASSFVLCRRRTRQRLAASLALGVVDVLSATIFVAYLWSRRRRDGALCASLGLASATVLAWVVLSTRGRHVDLEGPLDRALYVVAALGDLDLVTFLPFRRDSQDLDDDSSRVVSASARAAAALARNGAGLVAAVIRLLVAPRDVVAIGALVVHVLAPTTRLQVFLSHRAPFFDDLDDDDDLMKKATRRRLRKSDHHLFKGWNCPPGGHGEEFKQPEKPPAPPLTLWHDQSPPPPPDSSPPPISSSSSDESPPSDDGLPTVCYASSFDPPRFRKSSSWSRRRNSDLGSIPEEASPASSDTTTTTTTAPQDDSPV
eukprot:CAMPEP_0118896144 /NCGR_PEP_ID=MMETSP1166-20130328/4156_1 /TAXON_ID=1104430 /ORGANISM="Chrysoreinhardia sp, Strain CCMP3193" /LENGTH=797 /DNA_ID=CAMNT_0006835197 /DNA_START=37 /DNA_END=2430 /DNA_ORIENTATION=+